MPGVSYFSGAMLCAHSGTKILEAASGSDLTLKVTRKGCHNAHGWVRTTRVVLTLESGSGLSDVSPPDPSSLRKGVCDRP